MSKPTPGVLGDFNFIARPASGPVIVFLHGIGSNATSFSALFEFLPINFSLLAWNAPGYLASTPLEKDWPLAADYAEKLSELVNGLGYGSVHLVGHSLGALIAAAFARRNADRLKSLTLVSAAAGYGVPAGGTMPAGVQDRLLDLERLGPAAFARARASNLIYQPERYPELVHRVESAMMQINPKGYAQAVRMLASGNLCNDLAHVALRPGFIIGLQDTITPLAQTMTAAKAWNTRDPVRPIVTQIEGAGHAVYLQSPEAFCAALLDHIGLPAA
jgi:pimeloyl-ACP methyl ester carboxylesterase